MARGIKYFDSQVGKAISDLDRGDITWNNDGTATVRAPSGKGGVKEYTVTPQDSVNLKTGNEKLVKTAKKYKRKACALNIPALLTCPWAMACAFLCYALAGRFVFPTAMKARCRTYASICWAYMTGGEAKVVELIAQGLRTVSGKRRAALLWRIHDSGDFFASWYLRAVNEAIRVVRSEGYDILAYAYTKAIPLLIKHGWPSEINIVQSVGGTHDHLIDRTRPHSRIFRTHEARIAAGYVDGNGPDGDGPAIEGSTQIGLVFH